MRNLNITVLCNCRFPSTAAHSTYLARLCESFSENGAKVELVVPQRFNEVRQEPLKYYGVKTEFEVKKIWSFDFIIFGKFLGKLAFFLQYAHFYFLVLIYFLFRSRNRIIYTMDNLGPLLTFLGYKVVFETHIGIGQYRKFLLPLIRRSEKLVVVNSIIKSEFVKAGFDSESVSVAPNGVDLSTFSGTESKNDLRLELDLPESKKIIAYIGKYKTMGMDKGVDDLVRVFGSLILKRSDLKLLIVGLSTEEKIELANTLSRSLVPSECYKLVSFVSQKEVGKYMRASDVLVMNYPNTEYYRSFMSPMKMFEYMASGRPIVTTDLSAIREILDDDSAVFVAPDSNDALEQGILKLLNDGNFGKTIANTALEKVKSHTWKNRARNIIDFISIDK